MDKPYMEFDDLIDKFKGHLIENDKSMGTTETYSTSVKLFAEYVKPLDLLQVTTRDIVEYRNYLLGEKYYKVNTINNKIAAINEFYKFLLCNDYIPVNPCEKVRKIKIQDSVRRITIDENIFNKLFKEVESNGRLIEKVILYYLFFTGVRVSELTNIRISDITINDNCGILRIRSGKGLRYREIPLNPHVINITTEYLNYRKNRKIDSDYLIVTERSGMNKVYRSSINCILKKYGKRIGFPDLSPHVSRRYFLTKILSVSNIATAKNLAGHNSIQSTITYISSTEREKVDAILKLNLVMTNIIPPVFPNNI